MVFCNASSCNTKAMPKNNVILKTIFFGICFLCLFTTYNLSQGYLTTIFQGQGFIFIALIYFPYSFTSLISAWIGKRIGLKAVLLIGSSTYVIWTLVITTSVYPLIVTVALINGLGCSLLWVHEGIWLSYLIKSDLVSQLLVNLSTTTSSSQHLEDGYQSFDDDLTRVPNALIYESKESNESIKPRKSRDGTLNGLFFGIYNFSGIIGNIVTMILVQYYDFILILRIMSGFALLTWSLFWFIPYPSWHSWIISWNFITPPHSDSGSG